MHTRFIETTHLNRDQCNQLDILMQQIFKKYHSMPAVYWHILKKIRPYACNILAYADSKNLIGFGSRYLFHENECEISLMMHPKYTTALFAKQLFYKTLPHIPEDYKSQLIITTPHDEKPFLKPEKNWQLKYQSYRFQWVRPIKKPDAIPDLEIIKATSDDYHHFKNILETCFPQGTEMSFEIFNVLVTEPFTQIYLLKKENKPIGSIQINQENKWSRLSDLAILPNQQGHGYGNYLLKNILNLLQQRQKNICLDVESTNTKVYEWYCRMGFKKINICDFWSIAFSEIL